MGLADESCSSTEGPSNPRSETCRSSPLGRFQNPNYPDAPPKRLTKSFVRVNESVTPTLVNNTATQDTFSITSQKRGFADPQAKKHGNLPFSPLFSKSRD